MKSCMVFLINPLVAAILIQNLQFIIKNLLQANSDDCATLATHKAIRSTIPFRNFRSANDSSRATRLEDFATNRWSNNKSEKYKKKHGQSGQKDLY